MVNDPRGEPIAESIELDPKQFITEDQILELWENRGMKYRCDDLWRYLRDRGLQAHMRKETFRSKLLGFMRAFLVQGEVRRDPRHQPPPKKLKMR